MKNQGEQAGTAFIYSAINH